MRTTKMKEEKMLFCKRLMKRKIRIEMEPEDFQEVLEENEDESLSNSDSSNKLVFYLKYFFIQDNLKKNI